MAGIRLADQKQLLANPERLPPDQGGGPASGVGSPTSDTTPAANRPVRWVAVSSQDGPDGGSGSVSRPADTSAEGPIIGSGHVPATSSSNVSSTHAREGGPTGDGTAWGSGLPGDGALLEVQDSGGPTRASGATTAGTPRPGAGLAVHPKPSESTLPAGDNPAPWAAGALPAEVGPAAGPAPGAQPRSGGPTSSGLGVLPGTALEGPASFGQPLGTPLPVEGPVSSGLPDSTPSAGGALPAEGKGLAGGRPAAGPTPTGGGAGSSFPPGVGPPGTPGSGDGSEHGSGSLSVRGFQGLLAGSRGVAPDGGHR